MQLRPITAERVISLRHQVLRPHRPVSECTYPTDEAPGTFHLALTHDDAIIGCASAHLEPLGERPGMTYRLRGMAVLEPYRNQGLGARLLEAIEAEARQRGAQRIWCNGRISAERFYRRHGWLDEGPPFEIVSIPHRVFVKEFASP